MERFLYWMKRASALSQVPGAETFDLKPALGAGLHACTSDYCQVLD